MSKTSDMRSIAAIRSFDRACVAFNRWARTAATPRNSEQFKRATKRLHAAAERYAIRVLGAP